MNSCKVECIIQRLASQVGGSTVQYVENFSTSIGSIMLHALSSELCQSLRMWSTLETENCKTSQY